MGAVDIHDVVVTPLKRIHTVGGDVLHAMKSTDAGYQGFGESYFSWVAQGAIKAWKRHTQMTMNLVVPVGSVRFVFYSPEQQRFRTELIGEKNYARLTVPPGIWFGFQGCDSPQSLVLNMASIQHDPLEANRLPVSEIEFSWE